MGLDYKHGTIKGGKGMFIYTGSTYIILHYLDSLYYDSIDVIL